MEDTSHSPPFIHENRFDGSFSCFVLNIKKILGDHAHLTQGTRAFNSCSFETLTRQKILDTSMCLRALSLAFLRSHYIKLYKLEST